MSKELPKVITMLCLSYLAIAGLSGCASITKGTSQNVTVITEKDVTDASCELTDKKGGKWSIPSTPGTATVRKGDGPMTLICKKDGYKVTTHMVDETISGATIGNIILGGGIGFIVDAATGAAQHYPDEITIWMEPLGFSSEEEKNAWFNVKEEFYTLLDETENQIDTTPHYEQ